MDPPTDFEISNTEEYSMYLDALSETIKKTLFANKKAMLRAWCVMFIAELKNDKSVWLSTLTKAAKGVQPDINEHYQSCGKKVYPVLTMWRALEKLCAANNLTLRMSKCEGPLWSFAKERKGYSVVNENRPGEHVIFHAERTAKLERDFPWMRAVSVMPFPHIGTCADKPSRGKKRKTCDEEILLDNPESAAMCLLSMMRTMPPMNIPSSDSNNGIKSRNKFHRPPPPLPQETLDKYKAQVDASLAAEKLVAVGGIPSNKERYFVKSFSHESGLECLFTANKRRIKDQMVIPAPIILRLSIHSCLYYNKQGPPSPCLMYVVHSSHNTVALPDGSKGRWAFTSLLKMYSYVAHIFSGIDPYADEIKNNAKNYVFKALVHPETKQAVFPGEGDEPSARNTNYDSAVCEDLEMRESVLVEMMDAGRRVPVRSIAFDSPLDVYAAHAGTVSSDTGTDDETCEEMVDVD